MREVHKVLMELLNSYLSDEYKEAMLSVEKEVIEEALEIADRGAIYPIVVTALFKKSYITLFSKEELHTIKAKAIQKSVSSTYHTYHFLQVYHQMLEQGITPFVLKGLVCRNLYKDPDYRASTDEDLLLLESQFAICDQILLRNGFIREESSKDNLLKDQQKEEQEVSYYNPQTQLHIELHLHLFDPNDIVGSRLNQYFTSTLDHPIALTIENNRILTMSYTEHLLYLLLHYYKHFIYYGIGIRQIVDILLFTTTYEHQIHWVVFQEQVKQLQLEELYAAILQIGEEYLTLSTKIAGVYYKQFYQETVEDLLEDVIDGGIYGKQEQSRKYTASLLMRKVESRYQKEFVLTKYARIFCPPRSYMERGYPWVKKSVLLLPIAWGCRVIDEMKSLVKATNGTKRVMDGIYYERRTRENLLKKYGVL